MRGEPLQSKIMGVLVAAALLFAGCTRPVSSRPNQQGGKMTNGSLMIDEAAARAIAKEDARHVYRDLSIYRIRAELKDGNWHVDYELEGEAMAGGGPHYVISGKTGEILERRYEQ
jgi:hypothetical protein